MRPESCCTCEVVLFFRKLPRENFEILVSIYLFPVEEGPEEWSGLVVTCENSLFRQEEKQAAHTTR